MKSCCFTGHRIGRFDDELRERLADTVIELIGHGIADFYVGGALGFDLLCEKTIISLRKDHSQIHLHLLLPCPADEQVKGWNKAQIMKYMEVLNAADSVTVLSEHYTDDCMKRRNKRLVELADCCVCYCHNRRSGTGQTVRFAEEKGIRIINLAIQK